MYIYIYHRESICMCIYSNAYYAAQSYATIDMYVCIYIYRVHTKAKKNIQYSEGHLRQFHTVTD